MLGTLKLFYGFDDNFYGVFLKMDKVEEAYNTLKDEGLKLDLLNMLNMFSKHANKSSTMKCFSNLPKFDHIVQVNFNLISCKNLIEMATKNLRRQF